MKNKFDHLHDSTLSLLREIISLAHYTLKTLKNLSVGFKLTSGSKITHISWEYKYGSHVRLICSYPHNVHEKKKEFR